MAGPPGGRWGGGRGAGGGGAWAPLRPSAAVSGRVSGLLLQAGRQITSGFPGAFALAAGPHGPRSAAVIKELARRHPPRPPGQESLQVSAGGPWDLVGIAFSSRVGCTANVKPGPALGFCCAAAGGEVALSWPGGLPISAVWGCSPRSLALYEGLGDAAPQRKGDFVVC